jgi:hypothetical protein
MQLTPEVLHEQPAHHLRLLMDQPRYQWSMPVSAPGRAQAAR